MSWPMAVMIGRARPSSSGPVRVTSTVVTGSPQIAGLSERTMSRLVVQRHGPTGRASRGHGLVHRAGMALPRVIADDPNPVAGRELLAAHAALLTLRRRRPVGGRGGSGGGGTR